MPTICRFFGIVIRMYHREHGPPHFHARHGEYEAMMVESFECLAPLRGHPRYRRHLRELAIPEGVVAHPNR